MLTVIECEICNYQIVVLDMEIDISQNKVVKCMDCLSQPEIEQVHQELNIDL